MADDDAGPSSTSDSDLLYDECSKVALDCEEKFKKVFNQDELLKICNKAGLAKILDINGLMPLIQALVSCNLLISQKQKGGSLCWSLRRRDAAKQMQKLTQEEKMVYIMVEETQSTGIWIRNMKKKTGLPDQGINKLVDKLCKMRLIKGVKNVKAPAQKTYMLHHLAPSDDVTGGTFYEEGELDESLVNDLGNLIVYYVRQHSWVDEKRRKPKYESAEAVTIPDDEGARAVSPEESRGRKKRKASHTDDIEDAGAARKARRHDHDGHNHISVQLSYTPHHNYPDAEAIHGYITTNKIMRDEKATSLGVDEVQTIIDVLVWDKKLEPVNGGYRTVRGVKPPRMREKEKPDDPTSRKFLEDPERRGNGLTEMPCGRCPVLNICGKGGPINASNCVYFDQWLGMALDSQTEQGAAVKIELA